MGHLLKGQQFLEASVFVPSQYHSGKSVSSRNWVTVSSLFALGQRGFYLNDYWEDSECPASGEMLGGRELRPIVEISRP